MKSKSETSIWSTLFEKREPWCETVARLWLATPLFRNIPKREIRQLARDMHPRYYHQNEFIFHSHDQGAGAALIVSGQVEIRADDVLLAILGPGDYFGEISLVLDERRTADAVAVIDSELAFFLRLDLQEWIARAPRHGAVLVENLARILARRLQKTNQLVSKKQI